MGYGESGGWSENFSTRKLNKSCKIRSKRSMKAKASTGAQSSFLMPTLAAQLDPRQPLKKLADTLPWQKFEEAFGKFYSPEGRPAKPVRLMVGLLLLKQMFNLGDETVVAAWVQNPYWQYFCGMKEFQWSLPCDPSDLVYFRQRIGEEGTELILKTSAELHGEKAQESEVVIDTTVQEKNVTYPTDSKLCRKIIGRCWKVADKSQIKLRRRYGKLVRKCVMAQRHRRDSKQRKVAQRALRRMKTIAGRLLRELERKLPAEVKERERENFALYRRVLRQEVADKEKIYSLHEPQVYCVAKGKEHKKYEFGSKASLVMTKGSGVIVGALAHERNLYDGDTLPLVLEQSQKIRGCATLRAIVDRGYRGRKVVGETEVLVPGKARAGQSRSMTARLRKCFRRRAAIEPVIGHLKEQYRLGRSYLKGFIGDSMNVMLAAAAWNLRKWMREAVLFCLQLLRLLFLPKITTLLPAQT